MGRKDHGGGDTVRRPRALQLGRAGTSCPRSPLENLALGGGVLGQVEELLWAQLQPHPPNPSVEGGKWRLEGPPSRIRPHVRRRWQRKLVEGYDGLSFVI